MKSVPEKKTCLICLREVNTKNNFYTSNSTMFQDGRVPICKKCIKEQIDEDDIDSVKRILRQIDKPFIRDRWENAVRSEKETFGWYMREINSLLPDSTYDDSVDKLDINIGSNSKNVTSKQKKVIHSDVDMEIEDISELDTEEGSIKLDQSIKHKFGIGYTNREYLDMEKFYRDMMSSHEIVTPQHKKLLVRLCQLNIKIDNNIDDPAVFEKYMKQYDAILKTAGFRPADRVSGSESTGIRSFSQVYEEIEKDGFIVPTPISERQDIVDRTIQYINNYTLKLLNMESLTEPPEDTPKVDVAEEEYF